MNKLQIQEITCQELETLVFKAVGAALEKFITTNDNPTKDQSERLLCKKEAAEYLQISLPTLSKYIRLGFIRAHSVAGTRLRFKQSDLEKSLKALKSNQHRLTALPNKLTL